MATPMVQRLLDALEYPFPYAGDAAETFDVIAKMPADAWLDGGRPVSTLDFPDMRVSADQSREEDLAFQVDDLGILRDHNLAPLAYRCDGLAFH